MRLACGASVIKIVLQISKFLFLQFPLHCTIMLLTIRVINKNAETRMLSVMLVLMAD